MTARPAVRVLHLTAHLGGGVGNAVCGLVQPTSANEAVAHTIVCLEAPKKTQFVEKIEAEGTPVVIAPSPETLAVQLREADIVQVEWWGHPRVIASLCTASIPAMRLVLWCHVSGLHTPLIPLSLIDASHRCVFTSPCSYQMASLRKENDAARARKLDVIFSAGGIDALPEPTFDAKDSFTAGYVGTLRFSKLHPEYVRFLAKVDLPGFTVRMIGDPHNREVLRRACKALEKDDLLVFEGYQTDIAGALSKLDITPYLLNPFHFGTTENALLEAMAMGVVPIVLDHPAERFLVDHGQTGLVVRDADDFANAVHFLYHHPDERRRMARRASRTVRDRFTRASLQADFSRVYDDVMRREKRAIDFSSVFGNTPLDWFLSLQSDPDFFGAMDERAGKSMRNDFSRYILSEPAKSSVHHFASCFPDDRTLDDWSAKLARYADGAFIRNEETHAR